MFRFASSVQSCYREGGALQTDIAVCGEHSPCCSGHTGFAPYRGVCAFPVYTAQAPGCSIWSGPCVECGSSFRVLHNGAGSVAPEFCAFPASAAQAVRSLTGALSPGAARPLRSAAPASVSARAGRVPVACICSQELASSCDPPGGGCRPSRISGILWIETGGLLAVWERMPSLGLSLPRSPPPCLLPLAGMDWSAAG